MEPHEAEGSLSVCDTQSEFEFEFTITLILDGLEHRRSLLVPAADAPAP